MQQESNLNKKTETNFLEIKKKSVFFFQSFVKEARALQIVKIRTVIWESPY